METLEALRAQYPLLSLLLEMMVIGAVAIAVWFVFSVLFALLHSALKAPLVRAAAYFQAIADKLLAFGTSAWKHSIASVDEYVRQLSMKWVFVEQDTIMFQRFTQIQETVKGVGQRIDDGLGEMRNSMDSFRTAVEALAVPTQSPEATVGQASAERVREAASKRRTALVVLIVVTPLLLFLVALNTAMLTKFFESFIDEWLSFRWGIKISTVLGFFFSALEVALGIFLYYAGRAESRGIMPALKQLLYITMIGLLALIETYLYHRLALEMSPGGANPAADGLPGWVHGGWLALMGPVLVIALSAGGHELIGAINQFVDAGLEKSQQKLLEEMRRNWTALMRSGSDLQKRLSEVKDRCATFLSSLTGESDPNSAAGAVQQSISRLGDALETAKRTRLNPYASTNEAEGRRIFAFLSLKAVALIVLALLFCAVQFMYAPAGEPLAASVLIAGALAQAAAITIAAYRIRSQVVLLLDGQPPEVLEGSRERWTAAIAGLVLLAAVLYNCALAQLFGQTQFQWIPFLLSMVCLAAFALIGRTIPSVVSAAKVWVKSAIAIAVAAVSWGASALFWLCHVACRALRAILYVLAYPFFLIFWRKKLETADEPSVERV
jgi:hypothetical protein